jgi:uncharacterized protein (TIGR02678 family)
MAADEVRQALRHLLRRPLVLARKEPEAFRLIVRHHAELARWFGEQAGWHLSVNVHGRFARLFKVHQVRNATHPAQVGGKVLSRRHYVIVCLVLAALDDGSIQTTLTRLADQLALPQGNGIDPLDTNKITERRALTDVLRLLESLGILRPRDGDLDRYGSGGEADVLFDVDDRLLGQLIATPVSPTMASSLTAMLEETGYADTEDGRRLRARHGVMRRLLDGPVVYFDDLETAEQAWLEHSLGFVARLLNDDLGLTVERRREGMAAVDTEGELTDIRFPDAGSTMKHAALLLCEAWSQRIKQHPPDICLPTAAIHTLLTERVAHGQSARWSRVYDGEEGLRLLTTEALQHMHAMGLARPHTDDAWEARPVMARFAIQPGNNS